MNVMLEEMRSVRNGRLIIALYSRVREVVVEVGSFPENCPSGAVRAWVEKIQTRERPREMTALVSQETYS